MEEDLNCWLLHPLPNVFVLFPLFYFCEILNKTPENKTLKYTHGEEERLPLPCSSVCVVRVIVRGETTRVGKWERDPRPSVRVCVFWLPEMGLFSLPFFSLSPTPPKSCGVGLAAHFNKQINERLGISQQLIIYRNNKRRWIFRNIWWGPTVVVGFCESNSFWFVVSRRRRRNSTVAWMNINRPLKLK